VVTSLLHRAVEGPFAGPDQLDQGSIPPFLSEDELLDFVFLIFEYKISITVI
jgi:hypothetical protein